MIHLKASQDSTWAKQHSATTPDKPVLVLDVREAWEVQTASIVNDEAVNGFQLIHMPMRSVPARYPELDRHQPIACLCHHGMRSMQVAQFLESNGFTQVANVQGGIHAWATEHDNRVPVY